MCMAGSCFCVMQANFVRPFKRPFSSTCPVIVLKVNSFYLTPRNNFGLFLSWLLYPWPRKMRREWNFLTLSLGQLEEHTSLQPQLKATLMWSSHEQLHDSDWLLCSAASLGVLSFGWSLSDAIEAKRLHHQLYNNTLYVESKSDLSCTPTSTHNTYTHAHIHTRTCTHNPIDVHRQVMFK